MNEIFRKLATKISKATGSVWTFMLALSIIFLWITSGPIFNYSNTWQLMINTTTTVVTFLMVFIIQNTQNRDSRAIHVKLDELLRAVKGARLKMLDSENLSDDDLEALHQEFQKLHEKYDRELARRRSQRHSSTQAN